MLKKIREKRGLSQSELAEISCISVRTIQEYEQGRKSINKASAIVVYKLSKALRCKMEDLLDIKKSEA